MQERVFQRSTSRNSCRTLVDLLLIMTLLLAWVALPIGLAWVGAPMVDVAVAGGGVFLLFSALLAALDVRASRLA